LSHVRLFLADPHVDADGAAGGRFRFLADDRVDCDRRLAGLPIADDEFTLTAADRDHGIDRFEPRLKRLFNRLALDDPRRDHLDQARFRGLDRALAINRLAERIDDAADHGIPDGHLHDLTGAFDGVPFLNKLGLA